MKKTILFALVIAIILMQLACRLDPIIVDTEDPVVTILYPESNSVVGKTFSFSGTCTDDTTINWLTIMLDDTKYNDIQALSNFDINIDTSSISDGEHRFEFILTDETEKEGIAIVNLLVDKTNPVFKLFSPDIIDGQPNILYESVDFIGSVTDSGSGLNLHDETLNRLIVHERGDVSAILWDFILDGGDFSFSDQIITDAISGDYTVFAKTQDLAGNSYQYSCDLTLSRDENVPYLTLESPDPYSTDPQTTDRYLNVTGYATDNTAIASVQYNFLKTDNTPVFADYFSLDIDTTCHFNEMVDLEAIGLEDGSYQIVVRAVDEDGVFSFDRKVRFHKNAHIPTLQILDSVTTPSGSTPLKDTYHNTDFNIEVSCSQGDATIDYAIQQGGKTSGWISMVATTIQDLPYNEIIDISAIKELYNFDDGAITITLSSYPDGQPELVCYAARTFFIDETPPTAAITSHTELQVVNGGFVLSGMAWDNVALGSTMDIYNSDPAVLDWIETDCTSSWSYEIAEENDDGSIESLFGLINDATFDANFIIRVRDRAGNETTDNVTVRISPSSDYPSLYRYMPTGTDFYASGAMTVYFRIDDDDYSGKDLFAKFELLNGTSVVSSYTTLFNSSSTGFPNCSKVIDIPSLSDGATYTVRLSGEDWQGKSADNIEFSFTVDNQEPVISITTPGDILNSYSTDTIDVVGTISDENNINNAYLYYLDETGNMDGRALSLTGPVVSGSEKTYSFNCQLISSGADTGISAANDIEWADDEWGNGSHLFQIRTSDQSGLTASTSFSLNLDNHMPEITITSPEEYDVFGYQSDGFFDITGGVNDIPPEGTSLGLDFTNIKIELYKDSMIDHVIKPFGVTASSGDQATGTASSFTYRWHFDNSLVDANDYAVKIYAKDNADNDEVSPVTINLIKNTAPPVISSIDYPDQDYYAGTVIFSLDASAPNGVDYIQLLIDDVLETQFDYDVSNDFTLTDELLELNTVTSSLTTGQNYKISFLIRDGAGIDRIYDAGGIVIDNIDPVIAASIDFYNKDHSGTISAYSTFLRFENIIVTDNLSLEDHTAGYTIGTTSGGDEIVTLTDFTRAVRSGADSYEAVLDNYIDLTDQTGTLYITVYADDSVLNTVEREFTIVRASGIDALITPDFSDGDYFCDISDSSYMDDYIEFCGNVSAACDNLWISVDGGEEVPVTGYSAGDISFLHQIPYYTLTNGTHLLRLRANNGTNGTQEIEERTITVDNFAPVVTIDDVPGTLTGIIIFTGKFNDNFADLFPLKSNAALEITIAGTPYTIADSDIVRNGSGVPWSWQYSCDTTLYSGDIDITISATDLAGNFSTATITEYAD